MAPPSLGRIVVAVAALLGASQRPAPPAAPPPDTEIYLAPLESGVKVGRPVNITNSPGYDNQPSFTPDGASVLFTSIRGGGTQTDIYRYDITSGTTNQVTHTPESEYSPTVTPDGAHISVIRVEADGTQRLWRFTLDGRAPELVLPGVKPVGYHVWAGDHTLVLFVLGSPATLRLADTSGGEPEILVTGINRSIQRIPGGTISFVARTGGEAGAPATLSIRELDPRTRRITPLVDAPARRKTCCTDGIAASLDGIAWRISRRSAFTAFHESRSVRRAIASRSSPSSDQHRHYYEGRNRGDRKRSRR